MALKGVLRPGFIQIRVLDMKEAKTHYVDRMGLNTVCTGDDGRVYLKREEECLAGCAGAPMMVINGHYHERLTLDQVDALLDGLE